MPHRLQQAVWRFFDRLEDPPWPIQYRLEADAQLAVLRDLGVVAHTALAYAHRPGMIGWLNDYTLGLAERNQQVIPTFTIFPEDDVAEQTAAAIDRGGAAVKVHLQVGRFAATDPRLDEAWTLIARSRIPVVMHASAVYGVDGGGEYCGADGVRALLERHPDLTLVIAHLGIPQHAEFVPFAEQHRDLYLDVSMTLVGDGFADVVDPAMAHRIRALQPQILFGSDYPSIPHAYARQVRALSWFEPTADDLRALLHGTATRLLGQRVAR
jgi:predicted TIM-barrel fold metal-dependent hydrolase